MILFDWGTYNALSKLHVAAALGMRLTEIPPYDLSRRSRGADYFEAYREYASKAFTMVTAHAPYYNVVSVNPVVQKRSLRGLLQAVSRARAAGARVFNLHLGWRAFMDDRDLERAGEVLRRLAEAAGDMVLSVEVPYTRRMLGTWEEVKALREVVGEDKLIVSVQLENAWMLETGAGDTGLFEQANRAATEEFWYGVLRRALELSKGYLSLRFSQVIGLALGRRVLKKRVPLGKGYPDLGPLANAIAKFLVKEVRGRELPVRAHLIYTGPPETKYRDTVTLYAEVMRRAAALL